MDKKVTILVPSVPHYRRPFYSRLREYLLGKGIDLRLIHGFEDSTQNGADGEFSGSWVKRIDHVSFNFCGVELCWQPYWRYLRDCDLVIVQQANRLLLNYLLIAKRTYSRQKIAFWGHGSDLQRDPGDIRNRWKRLFTERVDWWFAYTEEVKAELVRGSFPAERITNVQNTIDTETLLKLKAQIPALQLELSRREMGLGGGPVGIYCGRIYREKRIEFLLEACRRVREREPNFELIVIGAGPESEKVASASEKLGWIHYVGAKYEVEKVPYFLLADVCLMPGLVGLIIIDCFALEVPVITTTYRYHSPEVTYLRNKENGLITENSVESYVAGVSEVLANAEVLARLKHGCREAASIYTMQAMVANFGDGIIACLECDGSRRAWRSGETRRRSAGRGIRR